jgi:hypothetical protein
MDPDGLTQRRGITVVNNMHGMSRSHFKRETSMLIVRSMQDVLPIRIGAIRIIHQVNHLREITSVHDWFEPFHLCFSFHVSRGFSASCGPSFRCSCQRNFDSAWLCMAPTLNPCCCTFLKQALPSVLEEQALGTTRPGSESALPKTKSLSNFED